MISAEVVKDEPAANQAECDGVAPVDDGSQARWLAAQTDSQPQSPSYTPSVSGNDHAGLEVSAGETMLDPNTTCEIISDSEPEIDDGEVDMFAADVITIGGTSIFGALAAKQGSVAKACSPEVVPAHYVEATLDSQLVMGPKDGNTEQVDQLAAPSPAADSMKDCSALVFVFFC